ncbi:putative P-loop ATPase/GTPase [Metallosphaera yellowstonensis MK1]|uniref:Putative P-loop ATPase/GTPase n=1 Tax=Metallosphaera yellowstonensis MK1 TaxID=671065 RepID=H2C919_9CREN|nr:ATPase [Metallosphaera yellowstonensis]EHP68645.1 putative P-loop ATPase/GTPase [Metallosphaera yellowstonensis MK1]
MRVLINGGLPYDSGKTRFGLALISAMAEVGVKLTPLKPVAGHNAWYSYSTLLRSVELNVLVGNDALSYYEITGIKPEKINPFDVLLAPVELEKLDYSTTSYNILMERGVPVMMRITREGNSSYFTSIPEYVLDSLKESLDKLREIFRPTIVTTDQLRQIVDESGYIVDEEVRRTISENDNVVIESYNNASSPCFSCSEVDYVFTVFPGRAFLVKGQEFRKFLSLSSLPPWTISSEKIFKYLRPLSFCLDPVTSKNGKILDLLLSEERSSP